MIEQTTIDETIAKLTPSERDAVCGRFSFANEIEQEDGEDRLHELGLWQARTKGRREPLTDLGWAVRRRLEATAKTVSA